MLLIETHRQHTPVRPITWDTEQVPTPGQLLSHPGRNTPLDGYTQGIGIAGIEGGWEMLTMNRWSIQRGLQVHPENPIVQEKLQCPLILGIPSLGAKRQKRLAIPGDERGREGGARALMRRQSIRAIGVQVKHLAARTKRKTQPVYHRGRLEPPAGNRACHQVAFGIQGIQVSGIACVRARRWRAVILQDRPGGISRNAAANIPRTQGR